ncbi:hypothetical protein GCM10010502_61840 [Kitasatospora aureofaciens]|uniref:Uncharacterized protein n=1 Tax=Kitasatospora aureofaciens TaxID=1894 RepID=A0A8H9LTS0_KITAU|nr:hypothetical protein GCM10010502_61840 [Kitasatospora aureofaciens]
MIGRFRQVANAPLIGWPALAQSIAHWVILALYIPVQSCVGAFADAAGAADSTAATALVHTPAAVKARLVRVTGPLQVLGQWNGH